MADSDESDPPKLPIGVRTADTMKTFVMILNPID
jgi:hypothetical protein